jgi:hypothetical protein
MELRQLIGVEHYVRLVEHCQRRGQEVHHILGLELFAPGELVGRDVED